MTTHQGVKLEVLYSSHELGPERYQLPQLLHPPGPQLAFAWHQVLQSPHLDWSWWFCQYFRDIMMYSLNINLYITCHQTGQCGLDRYHLPQGPKGVSWHWKDEWAFNNLKYSLLSYLFAVSSMKKTQGLDVDQTTFTIGSLSTVPAHVIRGLG